VDHRIILSMMAQRNDENESFLETATSCNVKQSVTTALPIHLRQVASNGLASAPWRPVARRILQEKWTSKQTIASSCSNKDKNESLDTATGYNVCSSAVRESQIEGEVHVNHIKGKLNPLDLLTKEHKNGGTFVQLCNLVVPCGLRMMDARMESSKARRSIERWQQWRQWLQEQEWQKQEWQQKQQQQQQVRKRSPWMRQTHVAWQASFRP
jgi:hypothetical protein